MVGFPRIKIQGIGGMVDHRKKRVSARRRRKRNGRAREGIEGPSRVVTRKCIRCVCVGWSVEGGEEI